MLCYLGSFGIVVGQRVRLLTGEYAGRWEWGGRNEGQQRAHLSMDQQ